MNRPDTRFTLQSTDGSSPAFELVREPVPQRWLVTGSCGQLGAYVMRRLLRDEEDVLGVTHRACAQEHDNVAVADVSDIAAIDLLLRTYRPTRIVHLATVSSPAEALRDPARAHRLDVDVTRFLADYAARSDSWLLYASSDHVWSGVDAHKQRERDRPSPATTYGRLKLAGEDVALRWCTVARFSLMYGLPLCPRPSTWARLATALECGSPITAYVDEFRTPIALRDAADVVVELGRRRFRGLVQVSGPDAMSTHSMFSSIAARLGHDQDLVRPATRPLDDSRPRNVSQADSLIRSLKLDCSIDPVSAEGFLGAERHAFRQPMTA